MAGTVQLNLSLVLPSIGADDSCIGRLTATLEQQKGIEQAHIIRDNGEAKVCLHYDPNLLPLAQVERLVCDAGAQISDRYRHEQLPFAGLLSADSADVISRQLMQLPGMLHANVNYAAGLASVAYDSEQLQQPTIEQTIRQLGGRIAAAPGGTASEGAPHSHGDHAGHAHGSAPALLPHWLQERWTALLVGLCGLSLLLGWAGATFFGLPPQLALGFFVLAYLAGGYDIATHALPGLLRGKFDTDVLMLAAAVGAALLGEWNEGAFLLFLFALGHAGEHYALDRARNAVNALGQLMPQTALVRRGDRLVEAAISDVQVGEIVVVRPGDRIPVDGTVAAGRSTVDQAPITGESVPVAKAAGDTVFAGTINQDAALDVQVDTLSNDNTLSRVMKLVAEAQSQTSPTQQFTQRFTAWFVPTVLAATALVAIVPWALGWMPFADSFYRAMVMLVAASPCALAIGTPAAVLAGIGQAARNGVLIKGGVHLENLGRVQVVAFDKTGTITAGRFELTDIQAAAGVGETELLQTAAAVEQQSNHPLAQAVVRAAHARGLALPVAGPLTNAAGRGVRSSIGGDVVRIGNLALFQHDGLAIDAATTQAVEQIEARGCSIVVVGRGTRTLGVLGLADAPRHNVRQTMAQLRGMGVKHLVMLTGDNGAVARRIAQQVGIPDVRAELLPEAKLAAITSLGQQYGGVAMVGDGVNDAPALATATVGIAMGGAGTAVALETADIALLADDIGKLPFAIGLSKASAAVIKQNLWIALGVIGLLLATSVVGLVPLGLAVVLHEGSTIVVVLNALRLLGYRVHSATG